MSIPANTNFPAIHRFVWLLLSAVSIITTINVIKVDAIECDTVVLYRAAIFGGSGVLKDEWPFIAALYYTRTSKYFCGGTIISQKHVLTAAHCIQPQGRAVPLSPDDITVRLGAYNLTDRSEKDAIDISVTQIHVHHNWNFTDERYDADIAILVLNDNITFSNHIRPVCMPPADFLIDGLNGTVVGWGKTENRTAEGIPRKIEINALNDTYCYETDKGIARYASDRSFCGEGSGTPDAGDSGGGFFATAGSGWIQFGTVSFVRPKETGNNMKVSVYTKLTSFIDWIGDKVERSGGNISVAMVKADLNCTYGYSGSSSDAFYGCWLYDLNIRQGNFKVKNFTGSHDFDRDNEDVQLIAFETGVMVSLPRNFGNIFKNLKVLLISVNSRRIFQANLQNLAGLEAIRFVNSSVTEFDENSLWDLPNLQTFEVWTSELKSVHPATFSRNFKLTLVHVLSSALKALPRNLFLNNLLLEHVYFDDNAIETIDENLFATNANLRIVSLTGNRLRHLSENVFRNNSELIFIILSVNRIKTMDEQTFIANSKLTALTLDDNKLEFLPSQLLRGAVSLEEIYLHRNKLKAIDEQFFEANIKMRKIFLHSNQLTRIPPNLFRNNELLEHLHLGRNSIEAVDENLFEKNSWLQKIYLEFNSLVELPVNLFKNNAMLEYVTVRENSLKEIDERTFQWNTKLRKINFRSNKMTFLPVNLFRNNSLLETVHLDGNSLIAIDEDIFQTNANLQAVYLSSNLLNYLPENLFRNQLSLQIVDLSENLFLMLNENMFRTNANLREFHLREGMLKSLPKDLFRNNSRLNYVNLRGNSLSTVHTNFTVLKSAKCIDLSANGCIDAVFFDGISNTHKFSRESRLTRNLTEFQSLVMVNCSQY